MSKIPGFLVSTTHYVLAFDGYDRFFRIHTGKGLYYGLALDGDQIYISCRNQTQGPVDAAARAEETGSILVLNAASLLPISEIRPGEFPLRDVHGIACFDGKLWVTSSFDNLIAIYDLAARRWTKWYPAVDLTARNRDVHHFNTIINERDTICVLAHNNGPSDLMYYDRSSLDLCGVCRLGCQSHDIFPVADGVGTCSSADGRLVSSAGWALRTGAFPRGVAFGKDTLLVGLSQIAQRSVRHETSGFIRRFTTDWRHAADYVLPGAGMVLAILGVHLDTGAISGWEPYEAECFHGRYNPLEPGNRYCPGTDGGVFAPEWHLSNETHRWTAARKSRMEIVVNPGEKTLGVTASSSFPGTYRAEVLLNGHILGALTWPQPGIARSNFALPPGVQGRCEVVFQVPHLWRPSTYLNTVDERALGVSIRELELL